MICSLCWLLWIWFAGDLVVENEPTAGGSSLSFFQPLLHSKARLSGHINVFFCLLDLSCTSAEDSFDSTGKVSYYKESLVLDDSWWCQVCAVPGTEYVLLATLKTACMDAENSDEVLGGLSTIKIKGANNFLSVSWELQEYPELHVMIRMTYADF